MKLSVARALGASIPWAASLPWILFGCVEGGEETEGPVRDALAVVVTVNPDHVVRVVPPLAYGIHASLYDNDLHDPNLTDELDVAGIALIRWPGGGYSDNYHFATHTMSPWSNGDRGYLADDTDFGSFVRMLDRVGRAAMITVNYGSNQTDDGPGEAKEAAAWVAYANGHPEDESVIGEDSTGYDWQTVGFWAGLRAATPLDSDDGFNFLRIQRPEPIGIVYWEVGNEVFGNGFYSSGDDDGFELDMHVPYDGTERRDHPDLSPTTYGQGVSEYVAAMKAVDSAIKVGAVLVTPPADYGWAPTWNDDVLSECGEVIDFGIIHWYPNDGDLTRVSTSTMPTMFAELHTVIERHKGDNPTDIEITVTEVGPPPGYGETQASVMGLFAADAYLGFIRHGVTNVDWLELHNGTFLHERDPEPGRAYVGIQFAHEVAGPGEELVEVESSRPTDVVAHAGVRQDGSLAVLLINTSDHRDASVTLETPGAYAGARVKTFAATTERVPEITPTEDIDADDGVVRVEIPPKTLALVELIED